MEDALYIGGASCGHYVRTAESPSRLRLCEFLRTEWVLSDSW